MGPLAARGRAPAILLVFLRLADHPPAGALADSAGGLAGACALSLIFMLGATVLLWDSASRLFGRRAAAFSAALFALLGTTVHLGTFATYDALSVLLVAASAWCVIRAGAREPATRWMIAAGALLAVANATAYTCLLFDPLVAALALLTAPQAGRGLLAARRAATVLAVTAVLLAAGLGIGGSGYLTGFDKTMLTSVPESATPLSVLSQSWAWTGLVLVGAVAGVIISWTGRHGAVQTWLLGFLAAALVAGPLEQAHLHTMASLDHHVGLGAWFAAIPADAVDRLIAGAPPGLGRVVTSAAFVVALAFPAELAITQSRDFSTSWANATEFISIFGPRLATAPAPFWSRILFRVAEYYLPAGAQWQRWSSTRNITRPAGGSTGGPTAASASVTSPGNAPVLRQLHRPRLLLPGRAELRRHHQPGPADHRGPAGQPALPRHPGGPLRHRDFPGWPGHLRHLAVPGQHEAVRLPALPVTRAATRAGGPQASAQPVSPAGQPSRSAQPVSPAGQPSRANSMIAATSAPPGRVPKVGAQSSVQARRAEGVGDRGRGVLGQQRRLHGQCDLG